MGTLKKNHQKIPNRRAISTIVGGLIFVVLLTAGFSAFYVALEVQRDTVNAQRDVSDSILEKTKEKFAISVATDQANGNLLAIQVKNEGTNPVEVGDIWIVNKSGTYEAKKHLIDYRDAFIPQGYGANILENTQLTMLPDNYDIKVVSTLGTIVKAELNVGGNDHLRADMFAIPPDVKIGKNVTLTMHVENIGNVKLEGVAPAPGTPNVNPPFDPPDPPIPPPVDLDPAESVFFTWKYKVEGPGLSAGNFVDFDSYAEATLEGSGIPVQSNTATEKIKLLEPDTSELIILTEDLLSRPGIFMVIPSPLGDAPERALWGINVVNPTSQAMYVSKLTISLITPRAQSQDVMFDGGGGSDGCSPIAVGLTSTIDWSCPANNQLMWENIASPQKIEPYSVFPFLAKVHPGSLGGSGLLEAVIVHGHVYTTVGEFGKAGYGSSMNDRTTDISMANVYLSKDPLSTLASDIFVNKTGVQSSTPVLFNVTLADFEREDDNEIDQNSRLIINIPKGWTLDPATITSFPAGFFATSWTTFSDGSSQIIGILNLPLDGSGPIGQEAKTIQFKATAPSVTNTKMYVMYVLADGKITNGIPPQDFVMGPLSEIILQVVP